MIRVVSIPDWLFQSIVYDDESLLVLSEALRPRNGKPAAMVEVRKDDDIEGKLDFS